MKLNKNACLPLAIALFLALAIPSKSQDVKVSCGVGAAGKVTAHTIKINCGLTFAQIKLIISEFGGLVTKELVQESSHGLPRTPS